MAAQNIEQVLDECRKLRNLNESSRHRTFYEFGNFLQDMVDFLIFGEISKDEELARFQEDIATQRKEYNAENFATYISLFQEYWKRRPQQTAEDIEEEMRVLRERAERK